MKTMLQNWLRQRRTSAAIRRAQAMLQQGRDSDEIIGHFKNCGFSQGLTSLALKSIGVGDSAHCKELVVHSPHWAEVKDANVALHKAIDEYLDQEG